MIRNVIILRKLPCESCTFIASSVLRFHSELDFPSQNDSHARERFVFAVNIQVPGSRHHSIVYYYVLNEPVVEVSRPRMSQSSRCVTSALKFFSLAFCFVG